MAIYACGGVAVAVSTADVQEKEKKEKKTLPRGVGRQHAQWW